MALDKQLISLPFAEGLDTKTDPKKTPAARLTVAENVVFEKAGMISRRRGHTVLSRAIEGSSDEIDSCEALAVYNDELLCFTGADVYSYSVATERWVPKGRATCAAVEETNVVSNTYEQKNADVAEAGGLRCVAWEDSRGGVRYSLLDTTTNTVIVGNETVAAAAARPRVVSFTGAAGSLDFAIFYADGVNLRYKRINVVTPTVIGTSINPVTTMHATNNHFDVCVIGDRLFIAFNTAANSITHTYLDNTWTVSGVSTTIAPTAGNPQCVSLFTDPDQNVWTAVGTSSSANVYRHNYALVASASFPVSLEAVSVQRITGVWYAPVASAVVFYEVAGAVASQALVRLNSVDAAAVVSGPDSLRRGIGLVGEAFVYGDELYVPAVHDSPMQATYFLIGVTAAGRSIVARVGYGAAGGLRSSSTVSNVITGSATNAAGASVDARFTIATHRKGPLETETGTTFTRLGCNLTSFDLATRARFFCTEAGGTLLISGGVVQMYDGDGVSEHGHLLDPEWVTDPLLVGGGGGLSAGDYQYTVVYERTDRTGRLIRSAPAVPKSITVAAGDRVTLTLPTLRLTSEATEFAVRLVVYRTLVNGTTFYRVTTSSSPELNITTVDSVTYTDIAADTAIESNELLYTTGDILANASPDACSVVCERAGRVYVAGFADENALQYSKQISEGEPVAFAAEFRQQIAETGGGITALAAMDDKTLIFKSTAIFYHAGDGPNDSGEQSDFGDAKLVASDVGCVDPASVVVTPMGAFFKSGKGFYLVDRGLGVTYIGAPIENWNAYTVTGATLVPNTSRVIFITANGPALVYDWFFQQWSTFTGHEAVGCVVWRGQFVMAKSDGRVFVADSTKHSDGDHPYRLRVVRAWQSFAGMTGFQRLYEFAVLGEYKGGHKLRVQVGYDFTEPFAEEKLWDVQAELEGPVYGLPSPYGSGTPFGGEWPLYLVRFQQGQQLCTSFRVAIEEIQTGDYNEALSLSELSMVVGVERGLYRLRASRSLGTT